MPGGHRWRASPIHRRARRCCRLTINSADQAASRLLVLHSTLAPQLKADWSARGLPRDSAWCCGRRLAHGCLRKRATSNVARCGTNGTGLQQTVQPHAAADVEGVVTKRGAWPDASGRIFLEVDGRVIIIADECTRRPATASRTRPRARGPGGRDAVLPRAEDTVYADGRRPHERAVPAPRQVAGVSRTRGCFWLQGGRARALPLRAKSWSYRETTHTRRFALPLTGQVIDQCGGGGEVAQSRIQLDVVAAMASSMRADGQELLPVNMDKMRGGASEADYRALADYGTARARRREVCVLLARRRYSRGLKRGKQRSATTTSCSRLLPVTEGRRHRAAQGVITRRRAAPAASTPSSSAPSSVETASPCHEAEAPRSS